MDPIDYTSAFANVPAPGMSFLQGVQGGAALGQLQLERQQKQLAAQQAQQQRADLAALSQNATPQAIAALMIKYPALSEQLKRGSDVLSATQQQGRLDSATQVYAALQSGAPEVATKLLKDQAAAARNSGNEQDAKAADTFAQLVVGHPEFAKTTIGMRLAAAVGPEKFAESFAKLGGEQRAQELQGDTVRKGVADADAAVAGAASAKSKAVTDGVTAKYAEPKALLDLEGIKADIQYRKDQTKIAYINAQIAREGNAIQKQKLQLDLQKAVTERDEKVRGKVADAESAAGNIDNMLNTIQRIKANPRLDAVLGSIEGRTPAITDDGSDAVALIETLGSQAFLSQIPNIKGMGALSNAEGEKLQAAFQNLSRVQSEKQFRATLDEATRLLNKGRSTVSKRFGVALGNPDTPAAAGGRPPLSSFGGQ
jgi:hypothetical protein